MHYTKGELSWESEKDLRVYFSDIRGHALPDPDLYFEPRSNAPLPDIVCRCDKDLRLRTRFHRSGDRYEHEILVETMGLSAKLNLGKAE